MIQRRPSVLSQGIFVFLHCLLLFQHLPNESTHVLLACIFLGHTHAGFRQSNRYGLAIVRDRLSTAALKRAAFVFFHDLGNLRLLLFLVHGRQCNALMLVQHKRMIGNVNISPCRDRRLHLMNKLLEQWQIGRERKVIEVRDGAVPSIGLALRDTLVVFTLLPLRKHREASQWGRIKALQAVVRSRG